jgi:hypothetical protein
VVNHPDLTGSRQGEVRFAKNGRRLRCQWASVISQLSIAGKIPLYDCSNRINSARSRRTGLNAGRAITICLNAPSNLIAGG